MKLTTFDAILKALNKADVRFLVAGGFAVNAHGYVRATYDVDLVIQLDSDNIVKSFRALATIGYKPMVPVTAEQFADLRQRQDWIKHKGMVVLNFHGSKHHGIPVDVFVTEPFDFDREYKVALRGEIRPGLEARFVSIPTLIKMKKLANRPKDLDDIEHLRLLRRKASHGK